MDDDDLIKFLEKEIYDRTVVAEGIEVNGDKWSHQDGSGVRAVTAETVAEAKRKIKAATEHLARMRG